MPIATHTGLTDKVFSYKPIDPPVEEIEPPKDRAFFADASKKSLLSAVTKVKHLTPYIGTELQGVQLSQLDEKQKDELALLVAEVKPFYLLSTDRMDLLTGYLREEWSFSETRTSRSRDNMSLRSISGL